MDNVKYQQSARIDNKFENYYHRELCSLNLSEKEKRKLLLLSAKLASKNGCVNNLKFIINLDRTLLLDDNSAIFRLAAEIEDFNKYKMIINFLLEKEQIKHFELNDVKEEFLKLSLGKILLNNINYLIEEKNVNFEISGDLLKLIMRTKNEDIINFFIFNTKINLNNDIKNWLLENNYENELLQLVIKDTFNKDLIHSISNQLLFILEKDKKNDSNLLELTIKFLQKYPEEVIKFKDCKIKELDNIILNQKLENTLLFKTSNKNHKI